jgi:hypothetical protein
VTHASSPAGEVPVPAGHFQPRHRHEGDSTLHSLPAAAQVDRESQTVVCDEELEDLQDVEELRDSLPDHQPRSPALSLPTQHCVQVHSLHLQAGEQ